MPARAGVRLMSDRGAMRYWWVRHDGNWRFSGGAVFGCRVLAHPVNPGEGKGRENERNVDHHFPQHTVVRIDDVSPTVDDVSVFHTPNLNEGLEQVDR